ncbi:hypothetical protein Tco_0594229 [Tanacetum coccineum]
MSSFGGLMPGVHCRYPRCIFKSHDLDLLARHDENCRFKPPSRSYVQMRADADRRREAAQRRNNEYFLGGEGQEETRGIDEVMAHFNGPDELPVLEDQPAQVIPDPHAEAISVSSSDEEVEPLTSNLVRGSRFSILDDDTLTSTTGCQFSRLHRFCPSQGVFFCSNEGRGPVRLFARGGGGAAGSTGSLLQNLGTYLPQVDAAAGAANVVLGGASIRRENWQPVVDVSVSSSKIKNREPRTKLEVGGSTSSSNEETEIASACHWKPKKRERLARAILKRPFTKNIEAIGSSIRADLSQRFRVQSSDADGIVVEYGSSVGN